MIAKGTTHDNGGKLAAYMVLGKPGERAELWQLRGFASDDIKIAFRSIHVMADATRCEQPLFHVQVRNPEGEVLTREQWERVADRIESKLGLTDQPRAIAFHRYDKNNDEHMHIGWSRIDDETMTAKALPFFKFRLKEVCRELETELGLTPVRNEREGPVMAPKRDEDEQARRLGVNIRDVRATIRECWEHSDNGRSFAAALSSEGLTLAKGKTRDFIAIDSEGGMHALGKRILGNTASEVRARMADLDREQLPDIQQARERIARLAMENALAKTQKEILARESAESKLQSQPARAEQVREIEEAVSAIRTAYRAAGTAADFAAELERNGIRLAVATAKEAEQDGDYQIGEIVAVNNRGGVNRLDEATIGGPRAELEELLASINRDGLSDIEATQEQIHLETLRHIEMSQIGILSSGEPELEKPDWRRMLTDPAYRRQVARQDREQEKIHSHQKGRSPEPDRY